MPVPSLHDRIDNLLGQTLYGISFITEDYIRRVWSSAFDVVNYRFG
jgi:hypothetical protein